jgi:hypothetical protein
MAEGLGSKVSSIGKAMTVKPATEKIKPYLTRMQLDSPATAKERMMQKLVIYALTTCGATL